MVSQGLALMLSQSGHAVVGLATDGEAAVKEAIEKKPDLILMDLKLPELSGIEATARIMEQSPIPVIAITGFQTEYTSIDAANAGAFGYLVKPISASDLLPAISIAMARFKSWFTVKVELEQLRDTLETRKFTEQAKGIIMQRLQLPEGPAYAHLREKCRNQQKTMKQASLEIIEAEHNFIEQLAKEPPSRMRSARFGNERPSQTEQT